MKNKTWMFQYFHERTYLEQSLEEFEKEAQRAAALGAEYVFISDVPKRREEWECQGNDPYPNWGMLQTSLFKLAVPDALKPWLDTEYAELNRELLKERARIAKQYGLKAALVLIDPFYLPEEVYLEHPNWRGPRCDHPRRSTHMYFAPCVDDPEVLMLYREAMDILYRDVDISYIQIITNDSGTGLCWSHGLYVGENGPSACRDIPLSKRLLGFLDVFTQAAADHGKEMVIDLTSDILGFKKPDPAMDQCYSSLHDGQLLSGRNKEGKRPVFQYNFTRYEHARPLKNIPFPLAFSKILWEQEQGEAQWLKLLLPECTHHEYEAVLEAWLEIGGPTYRDLQNVQAKAAEKVAGCSNADKMLQVWTEIDVAFEKLTCLQLDNFVMMPLVSQRLINRPLVPYPELLTEEEKQYYRPYLFQAMTEQQAQDYVNIQGMEFLSGFSASRITRLCCQDAKKNLKRAMQLLDHMSENEVWKIADSKMLKDRLKVMCCLIDTLSHAAEYQYILDSTKAEEAAELKTVWPITGDDRYYRMNEIARDEIDNAYQLAALLRGRTERFFVVTEPEVGEDIFLLSQNLPRQLEKKAQIMLAHMRDTEKRYESPNR
ncbi:MAG: hypothetical protein IKC46_05805 [Lachnospiraceae bacterium]|nr:hypothetical protein [Lachnospiraceae bacterium]